MIDITPEAVERFNRSWVPMDTAPRDGTWFVARTSLGYTRLVYFSDCLDMFPISDCGEVWPTAPVEWASLADVCHAIAALTASQAETAAAYETAACQCEMHDWAINELENDFDRGYDQACGENAKIIRALTPADSKAALDRLIAEARAEGMREAAGIVARHGETGRKALGAAKDLNTANIWSSIVARCDMISEAILAAIPKGTPHE